MLLSQINELSLVDDAITKLQDELSELYLRRRVLVKPASPKRAAKVNLDGLNLSINDKSGLTLNR